MDNGPEVAAREAADDLESLLHHDDTMSVSTIRTMEPIIYCSPVRSSFKEMGECYFNAQFHCHLPNINICAHSFHPVSLL